ncbi:MAG: hypothetical protein FJX76_12495 [Armatimonadetes bacterium]|nr:hypothetical protein [Armatimonadota bacterium]
MYRALRPGGRFVLIENERLIRRKWLQAVMAKAGFRAFRVMARDRVPSEGGEPQDGDYFLMGRKPTG